MTPEGKVKAALKKYFKAQGWYYYMPIKKAMGVRTVDFLVCANGRFFAIEAKSETGKLTELQKKTLQDVIKAGGKCAVARPNDENDYGFRLEIL